LTRELNESKKNCINICDQLDALIKHNNKNELQLELEKKQHHDSKEEIKYLEKELEKSDEHTKSVENELISSQFANNQLTTQIERLLAGSKNHTTMNLNLLDSIFILPSNTEDIHIPAKSYIQQVTEESKLFQVPKTVDIGVGTGDQLMFEFIYKLIYYFLRLFFFFDLYYFGHIIIVYYLSFFTLF